MERIPPNQPLNSKENNKVSKIEQWNSERGFGFVRLLDGRRAFLHINSFPSCVSRLSSRVDLTGREVEVLDVVPSRKRNNELEVVSAELIKVEKKKSEAEIIADEKRKKYETERATEAENEKRDRASAIAEARVFVQTLPEDKGVIVFPIEIPKPTQSLDKPCIEEFQNNWKQFISKLLPSGSNTRYAWAIISTSETSTLSIRGEYIYSHMEYKFGQLDPWERNPTRVFIGELLCGEGSPHTSIFDKDHW